MRPSHTRLTISRLMIGVALCGGCLAVGRETAPGFGLLTAVVLALATVRLYGALGRAADRGESVRPVSVLLLFLTSIIVVMPTLYVAAMTWVVAFQFAALLCRDVMPSGFHDVWSSETGAVEIAGATAATYLVVKSGKLSPFSWGCEIKGYIPKK